MYRRRIQRKHTRHDTQRSGRSTKNTRQISHQHLKINIKILSGKSGYELALYAERKKADLLVVGAPDRRFSFFDRIFTHDLEYIFANLPCDLLVINTKKQNNG